MSAPTLTLSGRRCHTSTHAGDSQFVVYLGEPAGKGRVHLLRPLLDTLDRNALHTLTIGDEAGRTRTLYNLVISREPECLSPDAVGDPDAVYAVELADSRWRCHNPTFSYAVNAHFNVRAPVGGSGTYYTASLNAGVAWTWAQLVQTLWELLPPLGAFPGLPFTPDGTPEGWQFVGSSAWLALCKVLRRIGCMVRPDLTLTANQFSIVQVGSADAATDATIAAAEAAWRKLHDGEFQSTVRGRVPYGVRVFFFRRDSATGTSAWPPNTAYTVDVVGPDSATAEPGTYHPIIDDEPALYDAASTLTNGAALATRAAERSDDFFRQLRNGGGERLHKVYTGVLALMPGSTVKAVAWRLTPDRSETGDPGVLTEVVRHPFPALPDALRCCEGPPALPQPLPTPSGSGTGGGPLVVSVDTTTTNAAVAAVTINVNSTSTPAAGFGKKVIQGLSTTTTLSVPVTAEILTWLVPTHASRTAQLQYTITDFGGTYTGLTVTTTGTVGTFTYALVPGGGIVTVGGGTSATEVRYLEPSGGGTSYISFKAPALAGNTPYTYPDAYPASSGVLKADASGNMSWLLAADKIATGNFTKTTDTTLADVTGLSVPLEKSKTYHFEAWLPLVLDTTGGGNVAVAFSGSVTSSLFSVDVFDYTTPAYQGGNYGGVNALAYAFVGPAKGSVRISGSIVPGAAGDLTIQFAQSVSSGASLVLQGASLQVWEVN